MMRKRARIIEDRLLPSTKIVLEEGDIVWLEIGMNLVYVYDNDGSNSTTQGLLYTFQSKHEANKHVRVLKEKK
jgi:hypothetical protein